MTPSGAPPDGPRRSTSVPRGEAPRLTQLVSVPTARGDAAPPGHDLRARTLARRRADIAVGRPGTFTLVVFLRANCDGCVPLWDAVVDPARHGLHDLAVVGVVRSATRGERREFRRLVPRRARGRVLIAPQAFDDYRVHGAPFFALVDGDGPVVATEGVAWAPEQLAADVDRARRARGR